MARAAAVRPGFALLAGFAIALGVAACDRPADKSAAVKAELTPTAPAIGPPPAEPAPVMPPKAGVVFDQSATAGTPANAPSDAATASGSDPKAKEPMTKAEESTSMPMPAQANDHSTTATGAQK